MTAGHRRTILRRRAVALAGLAATCGAAALLLAGGGAPADGQEGGAVRIEGELSVVRGAELLGSAPRGTSGDPKEAWAVGRPGRSVTVDGRVLERSVTVMRYTEAEGWRWLDAAVRADGQPYAGSVPSIRHGVSPRGGLALLGEGDGVVTLLHRAPGGRLRTVPAPPATVLLPGAGSVPDEKLSASLVAAADEGDATVAYVPVADRLRPDAVIRFDGTRFGDDGWSREPICVAADVAGTPPAGCSAAETLTGSSASLGLRSITAADGHAWLLGVPAAEADRPLVLFERVTDGGTPRWRARDLADPIFDGTSSSSVVPAPGTWTATAAGTGVWVDARVTTGAGRRAVTAHVAADGTVETWCDGPAAICDHPFGLDFTDGTRSFAWDGPGGRQRVLTGLAGGVGMARLEGTAFAANQLPVGGTAAFSGTSAFGAPDEGWIEDQHVTRAPAQAPRTAAWPLPVRRPLASIATAPGQPVGEMGSAALAVGLDGAVVRYTPGQGWDTEFLQGSSGVTRADLRGVAWPSAGRAFAVGDDGAMWRWRAATGLWEPDPGAPYDFVGQLTGIAFQPGDPERGYAVGREGVILRYGKSWEPEPLPAEIQGTGQFGHQPDITAIAFAGAQALAVARGESRSWLLVNDGSGWRVDPDVGALAPNDELLTVAGLPDGGAVAAGGDLVLVRDGAGAAWRATDQPLTSLSVVAAAPVRDGARVRAIVSVSPLAYPGVHEDLPLPTPGVPEPLPGSVPLPSDGYLLRETAAGWRDEQRTAIRSATVDKPVKSDPVLALALNGAGDGWLVGGWTGDIDHAGRGGRGQEASATAYVARYASGRAPETAAGARGADVALAPDAITLAVGGHPQCMERCAGLATLGLMPDRTLTGALTLSAGLAARPGGPRAFVSTGGRIPAGQAAAQAAGAELQRYAGLLQAGGALPTYSAASVRDRGDTAATWAQAMAGLPQPLGGAAPPSPRPGVTVTPVMDQAASGARTSYAFDSDGPEGRLRVVVIDNAAGSLEASDAGANPDRRAQGGQLAWLDRVLTEAQARNVPTIVVGSRALAPGEGAATDAGVVADLLRRRGVAAYVYDGAESNRLTSVPAGAADGVPAIAAGTLGYRSALDANDYGVPAVALLEVRPAARAGERPPVRVRLVPVLEELAIEAVDGRLLDRSQPALFQGLGRRPRSGDRWLSTGAGADTAVSVPGSSPYVDLPAVPCQGGGGGCGDRLTPEIRFTSSRPTVADFVRQDPNSTNPRRPLLDPTTDKPIPDASSGLICAFNEGTTTITVQAGGLSYSTTVTVRPGSVLRPCGTVPRDPSEFPPPQTSGTDEPTVEEPPAPNPTPEEQEQAPVIPPPPPPPAPPAPSPEPEAPLRTPSPPAPLEPQLLPPPGQAVGTPVIVPPLIPLAQPIPPSGTAPVTVVQPVAQTAPKEQREDEEAIETQSAFAKYEPDTGPPIVPVGLGVLAIAVLGYAAGQTRFRTRARPAWVRGVHERRRM